MSGRPALVGAAVAAARRSRWPDRVVRHNPVVRRHLSRLADRHRRDPVGRAEVDRQLLSRALGWAAATAYGRSLDLVGPSDLGAWPVLDKSEVKADESRFHASGRLPTVGASTGGSTGLPLRLRRSLFSLSAEQFFLDRLLAPAGVSFGASRAVVLRGDDVKDPADTEPPFGQRQRGGRRLVLSTAHLHPGSIAWYVDEIRRFAPEFAWVYPSTLSTLVRLIDRAGLELSIPVVVTSSEMLLPNEASLAAERLGARVIDYYGQAERVALAGNGGGDGYRFDPLYGAVELSPIDDGVDDGPEPGLAEAAVIGTGLWNSAMPLVRYATGDAIWYRPSDRPDQLERIARGDEPFVGIRGRRSDYLVTPEGGVLAGLNRLHHGLGGVLRMQLRQESPAAVEVLVVPRGGRLPAEDRDGLEANLRRVLARSMAYEVREVAELGRTAAGKTPYVIRAEGLDG